METGNVRQTISPFDMLGSFCVCKTSYLRNGNGNALMRKYLYNHHHIENKLGVTR